MSNGRLIVVTGRGGVGKSSFVALSSRLLLAGPKLLIDLDPDGSLPEMLGIDLAGRTKTISDTLYEIMERLEGRKGEDTGALIREMLRKGECVFRSKQFDLISLGTKFSPGCYCTPDEVIKSTLPELMEAYGVVLVDAPAGLEHLNRKITPDIDELFLILDPSEKSLSHINRVKRIIEGVKIRYARFFLVGNFRFTEETERLLEVSENYLGRIAFDLTLREYNLRGRSLLDLPNDSPSVVSVRKILKGAGLEV